MIFVKKNLYTVPVPSTAFDLGGPYMLLGTLRFSYQREGIDYRGGILFNRVYASRKYGEYASTAWQIEAAYDTLIEIENSSWVEELQAEAKDAQRRRDERWEMHHYLIYLDSFGAFEALADSWNALPEEEGSWPNPMTI
jgi:hypothetical protein